MVSKRPVWCPMLDIRAIAALFKTPTIRSPNARTLASSSAAVLTAVSLGGGGCCRRPRSDGGGRRRGSGPGGRCRNRSGDPIHATDPLTAVGVGHHADDMFGGSRNRLFVQHGDHIV